MEPDASLFSLRPPHPLRRSFTLLFSFFSIYVQRGRANYLPPPWPPPHLTHPCFPPRLVFQLVSLFNSLIPPSLIKHDRRPCEATHPSSPPLFPLSHIRILSLNYRFYSLLFFLTCPSSLHLSSFSFLLSLPCAPQVISFNSSKLFMISAKETKPMDRWTDRD